MRRTGLLAACVLLTTLLLGCASTPSTDNNTQQAENPSAESPVEAVPSAQDELVLAAEVTNGKTVYYNYDQDGTLLGSYSVYSSGNMYDYTAYEYANGLLIKKQEYDIAQFDVSNNTFRLGDINNYTTYEYDQRGELVSETYFGPYGEEFIVYRKSSYDSNGNITVYETYAQGEVRERVVYEYDSYGNITSEVTTDLLHSEQKVAVSRTFEYDEAGNVLKCEAESRSTDDNVSSWTYTYEYNADGTVAKSEYTSHQVGALNTYTIYTYDENANLIDESTYRSSGSFKESVSYTYDEQGNMIATVNEDGDTLSFVYDTLANIIANPYATLVE